MEKHIPDLKSPVFVNLDLTSSCNQQCVFCAVSPNRDYKFRKKQHFFKILNELNESDVFEITLFGGEPLLHPEVEEICKYAYDCGFEINVVTNGTFPEKCKRISKYLTNASVSIHGFKNTHEKITQLPGSYERAISSLKTFIDENVDTAICYTLVKPNYREMKDFIEHIFRNYEVKGCVLDRFVPVGFGVNRRKTLEIGVRDLNEALAELDKLGKEYKKGITTGDGLPLCLIEESLRYIVQPCQAGILFTAITENGDVKLCPSSRTLIGNLFEENLEDIWNGKWYKEYRSFKWLPEKCKKCSLLLGCYGGCKVSRSIEPYSYDVMLEGYL